MKRLLVSHAIARLGLASTMLAARRRLGTPWLTVLTYHRVGADEALDPFDPALAEVSATAFDNQLAQLRREFDFVGIDDVLAHLKGRPLPPSPLMLTFDDGYRDNHDVALPLLRRHGARATFFVATSFIDERRLFWWDRIHYVLARTPRVRLVLRYPWPIVLTLRDSAARHAATERMLELVKSAPGLDLARFLDELTDRAAVHLPRTSERELVDRHVMSWDHVRALRRAGMDVQSHTHRHRVVQTLTHRELVGDLRESRGRIEDELREPVRALSYPVGRSAAYSPAVRAAVSAGGYSLAFSNRSGVNWRRRFDPLDVRRVRLDSFGDPAHFRALLALPALAY